MLSCTGRMFVLRVNCLREPCDSFRRTRCLATHAVIYSGCSDADARLFMCDRCALVVVPKSKVLLLISIVCRVWESSLGRQYRTTELFSIFLLCTSIVWYYILQIGQEFLIIITPSAYEWWSLRTSMIWSCLVKFDPSNRSRYESWANNGSCPGQMALIDFQGFPSSLLRNRAVKKCNILIDTAG